MLNNYYIIKELANHLNNKLSSAVISECFSQEKDQLIISVTKNGNFEYLLFSCFNNNPSLLLRENYSKAKKNTAALFQSLNGLQIMEIYVDDTDRIIYMILNNGFQLAFSFASGKENFFIVSEKEITGSFKEKSELKGKIFSQYFLKTNVNTYEIKTVKDYLKNKYIKLGKTYYNEIYFSLNISPNTALTETLKNNIDAEIQIISNKISKPEFILYDNKKEIILSLIQLKYYDEHYSKIQFKSIIELINEYYKISQNRNFSASAKNKILSGLETKLKSIDSKISNLASRLDESLESVKYKNYGEAILENINNILPRQEYLEIIKGESNIKIKLNTTLSPSMNAQRYFQKYKRQKESVVLLKSKLEKHKKEKQKINEEILRYNEMSDFKEIKKISKSIMKDNIPDETAKFRKFILNDDFQVWVGKDSKSNDLLTMKYTAPNDLWFHIRGTSGSHTVLKTGNKTENIDKQIIETAASICAYYSKARNAGTVPVAFCLKKYIKKRKGFKEGLVVMEREKVIFVKPKLPEGIVDAD